MKARNYFSMEPWKQIEMTDCVGEVQTFSNFVPNNRAIHSLAVVLSRFFYLSTTLL